MNLTSVIKGPQKFADVQILRSTIKIEIEVQKEKLGESYKLKNNEKNK